MDGNTPVNIAGVFAFPNDADGGMISFIDSDYNPLFRVPDGENIIVTAFNDGRKIFPCRYIDSCHARIGSDTFHIRQFAEAQERAGAIYAPEHPQPGDILDSYIIYQLKDVGAVPYGFRPYEEAKGKLKMAHYERAYRGVLASKVTLDDLFRRHNRSDRPFGWRMRSMSMSDVVVLNRGGEKKAYYVDQYDFQEVKQFLNPPVRKRKRPQQER